MQITFICINLIELAIQHVYDTQNIYTMNMCINEKMSVGVSLTFPFLLFLFSLLAQFIYQHSIILSAYVIAKGRPILLRKIYCWILSQ